MGITQKGMVFSIDAMVAFSITLLFLLGFALFLGNYSSAAESKAKSAYLEEKVFLAADSFVKNHNPENALLGACAFDAEKKRVRSNELSPSLVSGLEGFEREDFFVKRVSLGNKTVFSDERKGEECVAAKRMAFFAGTKVVVVYEGCLVR